MILGALVSLMLAAPPGGDTIPVARWTERDWQILAEKVRWGVEAGLDTVSTGQAIARLGVTFVGTRYTPGTLEVATPEALVINLRELDCVTFIENVLALVRFIRVDGVAGLANEAKARRRYERYLQELRYRDGTLDGYPSRLHYFSEWLTDNARRGHLALVTPRLEEAVPDSTPLDFMSAHPDAYRQLADPSVRRAIRAVEQRLNRGSPRWFVPEERIAAMEHRIEDGDLIAATSTLAGLDVAHTGIALWRDGRLYLLHAPLVGKAVEISDRPLAGRLRSIATQDGIMVARVTDPARRH